MKLKLKETREVRLSPYHSPGKEDLLNCKGIFFNFDPLGLEPSRPWGSLWYLIESSHHNVPLSKIQCPF